METTEPEGTEQGDGDGDHADRCRSSRPLFEEIEVDAPAGRDHHGLRRTTSPRCTAAGKALEEKGIRYEVRVMSAHRDPEKVREYCYAARMRGLKVIIAGAGMSAALPGVAAAHTDLPVLGVPLTGSEPRRDRRAALGRSDAAGRARRLRRDRRLQERRAAGGTHHRQLMGRARPGAHQALTGRPA